MDTVTAPLVFSPYVSIIGKQCWPSDDLSLRGNEMASQCPLNCVCKVSGKAKEVSWSWKLFQWLNSYLIEKSVWEKWNLKEKAFWAPKQQVYGLNIKLTAYKVGNICESQWYRVSLNKKFIVTPRVPHGFQTETQVKDNGVQNSA